jgi:hypothetical protein
MEKPALNHVAIRSDAFFERALRANEARQNLLEIGQRRGGD